MVNQYSNLKEIHTKDDHLDKIKELYEKTIHGYVKPIALGDVIEISKLMNESGENYRQSDY